MKKLIILILTMVLICFMLPIIFTKKYTPQEVASYVQEKEYDYIKLKGKTYYIKFDKQNKLKELLKFLEPYKDPNGYTLNIETNIKNNRVYTKYSINFDKVEEYIKKEVG